MATAGKRSGTRKRVIEIAAAMLREGGYVALSLDGVAQQIGIRTPSLYYHFPEGKEGLLLAVALQCAEIDGEAVTRLVAEAADPVSALRAVSRHFSSVMGHHPYGAINASRRSLSEPAQTQLQVQFAAKVEAPLCGLFQRAVESGAFRDCDAVFAVRAFLLLMLGIGDLIPDHNASATVSDRLVDLFILGLEPR